MVSKSFKKLIDFYLPHSPTKLRSQIFLKTCGHCVIKSHIKTIKSFYYCGCRGKNDHEY